MCKAKDMGSTIVGWKIAMILVLLHLAGKVKTAGSRNLWFANGWQNATAIPVEVTFFTLNKM